MVQLPSLGTSRSLYDARLLHDSDVDHFLADFPFLTCLIWCSLVLGTRTGDEGTCAKTLCVSSKPDTNLNTFRTYCTMLGLFTTVVLFLRLRSTSLWKTSELSLK